MEESITNESNQNVNDTQNNNNQSKQEQNVLDNNNNTSSQSNTTITDTKATINSVEDIQISQRFRGPLEFQSVIDLPVPRCWFGSCLVENELFIFGGYSGKKGGPFLNDIYALNLDNLSWRRCECTGSIPERRYSPSFLRISNNRILLFGGSGQNNTYYNGLYLLEIQTMNWTKITPKGFVPSGRNGFAHAVVDNKFYLHGGDQGLGKYLDDLYILDLDTWIFSVPQLGNGNSSPKPTARGWHSMSVIDKKIYMFGGCNDRSSAGSFSEMWILHTETLVWELIDLQDTLIPKPRWSHTCISVNNNNLVLIGGKYKDGGTIEVFWFDTQKSLWWIPRLTFIDNNHHPLNRFGHCSVHYNGTVYLFGGFNGTNTFNDVYMLELAAEDKPQRRKIKSTKLQTDLSSLLDDPIFSDVTLSIDTHGSILAHKNILCSRSLYFRTMFTGQLKESHQNIVTIKAGVSFDLYKKFVRYLYCEQLNLDDVNEALELLYLANLHQIDSLKEELADIVGREISLENCSRIFSHAKHNECRTLIQLCKDFMTLNFDVLKKIDSDFHQFEPELKQTHEQQQQQHQQQQQQ